MPRFSAGIIYMILAAFFFSLMAVSVKLLQGQIPSQELVLARSVVMSIIGIIIIKKNRLSLFGNNKKLLFLRGFFGFIGLSIFFYTLTTIPIAESIVIQYTSPLFTAFFAAYILKEKNSWQHWLIYLIAFSGILFIVKPGFSQNYIPALIGLGGAAFAGLAYNLVRKLSKTENPIHIILYLPFVSGPLTLPTVIPDFVMPRGIQWIILLAIGVLTFIAQIFLTKGLKLERAAKATTASYVSIVFSTIFGWIIWNEIPDIYTIVGATIIMSAIYFMGRISTR